MEDFGDFPGGPVVKTSPSKAGGAGSIPDRGAKIPHASWPKKKNKKQKQNIKLEDFGYLNQHLNPKRAQRSQLAESKQESSYKKGPSLLH